MTTTNEKLRSLFLAALMVFSVFGGTIAFSGASAAANTAGNNAGSVAPDTVPAGDTVTHVFEHRVEDVQIQSGDDNDTFNVVLPAGTFAGTPDDVTVTSDNGENINVDEVELASSNNLTVYISPTTSDVQDNTPNLTLKAVADVNHVSPSPSPATQDVDFKYNDEAGTVTDTDELTVETRDPQDRTRSVTTGSELTVEIANVETGLGSGISSGDGDNVSYVDVNASAGTNSNNITTSDIDSVSVEAYNESTGLVAENRTVSYDDLTTRVSLSETDANSTSSVDRLVVVARTSDSFSAGAEFDDDPDAIDAGVEAFDDDGTQRIGSSSPYDTAGVQTATQKEAVVSAFVNSFNQNQVEDANVTIIRILPDGSTTELNPDNPLLTDSAGETSPVAVPLGTYRVRAQKSGFTSETSAQVTLTQDDSNRQFDVTLEAASDPQDITLEAVDENSAPADGTTELTYRATVFGDIGNQQDVRLENVQVELTDDGQRIEAEPGADGDLSTTETITNTTDANGETLFTVRSDTVQSATLNATVTTNDSVFDTAPVSFGVLSGEGTIQGQVFAEDQQAGLEDARVWTVTNDSFYSDAVEITNFDVTDNYSTGNAEATPASGVTNNKDYFRIINTTTNETVSVDDYRVQRGTSVDQNPARDEDDQTTNGTNVGNIEFLNESDKGVGSGFFVNGTSTNFTIVMLEAGNYTLQVSDKAPNASRQPTAADTSQERFTNVTGVEGNEPNAANNYWFTTDSNLTYERAVDDSDSYSDGGPVLTDLTDEDGDYQLVKLFSNFQDGQYYTVIGDKAAYSTDFGDVLVTEDGATFEDQDDEILNLKPRDVTPVVNITNYGFAENESAAAAGDIDEFENKTDQFNQTIRRDGSFVDVINVTTTAEDGNETVNATVTLEVPDDYVGGDTDASGDADDTNFEGEFINVVGATVSNVQYDSENDSVTFNTGSSGEAVVWLEADRSTNTLLPTTFDSSTERTRIEATVAQNARGGDKSYKRFVGITQTASISGIVTDGNNNPIADTDVWIGDFALDGTTNALGSHTVEITRINETYYEVTLINTSVIEVANATVTGSELANYRFQDFSDAQRQEWGLVPPTGTRNFTLYTTSAQNPAASDDGAEYTLPRVPAVDSVQQYTVRGVSPSEARGNGTAEVQAGFTDDANIVIEEATEQEFTVSNLSPQNVSVGQGSSFTVDATITNNGDIVDTTDVELAVDTNGDGSLDTVLDSTTTSSLSSGEAENVTLTGDTSGLAEDSYTFGVRTPDDEETGTLNVTVQNPPNYQVNDVTATPSTINQSENLTVDANVTNIGGPGSDSVSVEINGTNVSTGAGQVDIVFLIDTSGSMSDKIASIQSGLTTFTNNLESQGIDVRYAVVTFADQQPYNLRQSYTSNVTETQNTLNAISTGGTFEDSYGAINGSIDDLNERSGADEYFITFTDEDSDTSSATPSQSELANRLDSEDISLFAVSPGDAGVNIPNQGVGSLANSTQNGQFFNIFAGNFSQKFEEEISGQIAQRSGGQTISLNASESGTVTFEFGSNDTSNLAPGNYTVTVSTSNSSASTPLTVQQSGSQSIVDQYDDNNDGDIDQNEVLDAIVDFNTGQISQSDVLDVIVAFNS